MNKESKFPIELLDNLVNIEHSCIEVLTQECHLVLNPFHLKNVMESIENILKRDIMKYQKKYDGILLNYKNLKLLPMDSLINRDNVSIHINIEADFFVFKPKVGKILMATVNKKFENHVGALVYNMFNISLPNPKTHETWIGAKVKIGFEIAINVTDINYDARLPFIEAEIVSILSEADSGISTEDEQLEIKPKKIKFEDNLEDEHVGKKSKKIKYEHNTEEEIPTEVTRDLKKKKKSKKKRDELEDILSNLKCELNESTDEINMNLENGASSSGETRKKKKHREKKKKNSTIIVKQEVINDEELQCDTKIKSDKLILKYSLKSWDSDASLNCGMLFNDEVANVPDTSNVSMADDEDKKSKRRSNITFNSDCISWDNKCFLPDSDIDEIVNNVKIKEDKSDGNKLKRKRKHRDSGDDSNFQKPKKHKKA